MKSFREAASINNFAKYVPRSGERLIIKIKAFPIYSTKIRVNILAADEAIIVFPKKQYGLLPLFCDPGKSTMLRFSGSESIEKLKKNNSIPHGLDFAQRWINLKSIMYKK